ncbi:flagellar protein FlaG [Thiomicrorhabdus sp. zzn3]|uniref:flagellar protein FlaG n=1 Tax=Thiomicrorhabdus sp. zzn3 TaxID=3039775 RepID=UPI002436A2F5|nr:flagellar protein FlaG [Thiomicrorhabdus sp. zzn3]MDG6777623.1 flagellar protein FlaG [Thiomicrorhabdus sp. zzn3]
MEINSLTSPAAIDRSLQSSSKSTGGSETNRQQAEVSVKASSSKTTMEEVVAQSQKLNQQLTQMGQSLAFSIDESTSSSVVKVIDKTTDEVIRQFPTEGSLKIMHNIQNYLNSVQQSGSSAKESLTGTLFNEII